jgi:hypothetical protein
LTGREEKDGKVKEGREKGIRMKIKNLIEETADRIRKTPGEFKGIMAVRYEELREFTNK